MTKPHLPQEWYGKSGPLSQGNGGDMGHPRGANRPTSRVAPIRDRLWSAAYSIRESGVTLSWDISCAQLYVDIKFLYVPLHMRGAGVATNAFKALCRAADQEGYILSISPCDDFGADAARFDAWCGRFGFLPPTGTWHRSNIPPRLIRHPKHRDPTVRPPGRGWTWRADMGQWVWKSYPELRVETGDDGSLRYMGWDGTARSGRGEWYELPEFVRTDWVFQYLPHGRGVRARTREQSNADMRRGYRAGFHLCSWQVENCDGKPMWIGSMMDSSGYVMQVYECEYSPGEEMPG